MLFYNIPILIGRGNIVRHILSYGFVQEGGSAMNLNVTIDWKFVVALGTVVIGTIFAVKMDADATERVSIHAVDACKEYAIAGNSDC